MKVKVLKKFKDKETCKIYKKGEIITLTKKRFTEILKVGPLVQAVSEEPAEETVNEEAAETVDEATEENTNKTAE